MLSLLRIIHPTLDWLSAGTSQGEMPNSLATSVTRESITMSSCAKGTPL